MKYVSLMLICLVGCTNSHKASHTMIRVEIGEFYSSFTFDPKTQIYEIKIDLPASKQLHALDYQTFLITQAQKEASSLCKEDSHVDLFEVLEIKTQDNPAGDDYYRFQHTLKCKFKCKRIPKSEVSTTSG